MWSTAAAAALPYREAVTLCVGFAVNTPRRELIDRACPRAALVERSAQALVLFASVSGPAAGDRGRIVITGPDGTVVVDHTEAIPSDKAVWFQFAGARQPGTAWPPGLYTGHFELTRGAAGDDGKVLLNETRQVEVR